MTPLRAVALAATLTTLVTLGGCPCGGYNGGGDRLYHRGNDTIILCSNGGYAATIGAKGLEGRYSEDSQDGFIGSIGATGARAFEMTYHTDGSGWTSPELGSGWDTMTLDKTALDHADVQCTDLATRSWWATPDAVLPVATAFEHPVFPTPQACADAQAAGTYPIDRCYDALLLCADGTVEQLEGDVGGPAGTYTVDLGAITGQPNDLGSHFGYGPIDGTFAADGTLVMTHSGTVWTTVALSAIAGDLACE